MTADLVTAPLSNRRRLDAVRASGLVDRPAPPALGRLARVAAHALDTAVGVVWLVLDDHQLRLGAGGPVADQVPATLATADAFCRFVIDHDGPVVIDDVADHPLTAAHPRLREHGASAYAGVPLRDGDGAAIGTFCVMDLEPRGFTGEDVQLLADLAETARSELTLSAVHTLRVGRDGRPGEVLDRLTGVADRETLELRLGAMLAARASTQPLTLMTVDIEDFRLVNESFGEAAGDVTLREVARRLTRMAGSDGLVARIGGDRFVLVDALPDDADPASLRRFADGVRAELARPCAVNGIDFRLEVNIGASAWPDPASDAATLLEQSEQALRSAKRDGLAAVAVYAIPAAGARERLTLTARLSRAMARGELELHYQPIVTLDPERPAVPAFEALLRWLDPDRGPVPPATFIPAAEQSDLIHELGEWVIDDACRQLAAWGVRGLEPRVAVNLSPRQLGRANLAERVAAALARHDVPGERLFLELTESAVTHDAGRVEELLGVLNELGTPLSIDDFGTGESSLTRLRDLPFRALKLDRSFLRHLPGTRADREVVEAVLRLADALGMVSVAEGVETEDQHAFLAEHGCTFAQGFLYARPMPAAHAERLMRAPGGITAALRARR